MLTDYQVKLTNNKKKVSTYLLGLYNTLHSPFRIFFSFIIKMHARIEFKLIYCNSGIHRSTIDLARRIESVASHVHFWITNFYCYHFTINNSVFYNGLYNFVFSVLGSRWDVSIVNLTATGWNMFGVCLCSCKFASFLSAHLTRFPYLVAELYREKMIATI